jgi:hypothetical protein
LSTGNVGNLGDHFYDVNGSFLFTPASEFSVPVPEPATIIAGALLLLPFGASTVRILRRNRST